MASLLEEDFVDVREMHLETVFVFVDVLRHVLKEAGVVKFCCGGGVDGEISQGCTVVCAFC